MAETMTSEITPEIAAHVLYECYDSPKTAMKAGSFIRSLIAVIGKADTVNKLKLGLGFPGYVQAVDIIQNQADGVRYLESIAAQIMVDPERGTYDGSATEAEKTQCEAEKTQ